MKRSWVPDEVLSRYVDGELPWFRSLPVGACLILSPRLRRRVRSWRLLSTDLKALVGDPMGRTGMDSVEGVPARRLARARRQAP